MFKLNETATVTKRDDTYIEMVPTPSGVYEKEAVFPLAAANKKKKKKKRENGGLEK